MLHEYNHVKVLIIVKPNNSIPSKQTKGIFIENEHR